MLLVQKVLIPVSVLSCPGKTCNNGEALSNGTPVGRRLSKPIRLSEVLPSPITDCVTGIVIQLGGNVRRHLLIKAQTCFTNEKSCDHAGLGSVGSEQRKRLKGVPCLLSELWSLKKEGQH
ncbi:hypothetical protein TNCV_4505351 [Trichonephila clavipes]|nr:hypothetical protein TNCV_4505351 [Trichonephila clavipes]